MKYVEWMQLDGINIISIRIVKRYGTHIGSKIKLDMVTRRVSSRQQRKHPAKKPRKINQALRKRKNKVRTEAPLHLSSSLATIQNHGIDQQMTSMTSMLVCFCDFNYIAVMMVMM